MFVPARPIAKKRNGSSGDKTFGDNEYLQVSIKNKVPKDVIIVQLYGYVRANGDVGFRNSVLVLSTVLCSAETARRIAQGIKGVNLAAHVHGCGHVADSKMAMRTLVGCAINPNIASVLVVGLGCEKISAEALAGEIAKSGKPVEFMDIQKVGGTEKTIRKGRQIVRKFVENAKKLERQPVEFSNLIVGLNCGGSDTFSGLSVNPAVGVASDLIVQAGGTVILTEVSEFIGAEHVLASRAATEQVAKDIYRIVDLVEQGFMSAKVDMRGSQPTPGNIRGGLTSIEEKSLGGIAKMGSTPINQVIRYAEKPSAKGVVVMDGSALDVIANIGMMAAGAQIVLFTTGLGTPIGSPIAPVIKLTGNESTYLQMKDNFDIATYSVLEGSETLKEAGQRIFNFMVDTVNGKTLTKSEKLKYQEFDFWRVNPNSPEMFS